MSLSTDFAAAARKGLARGTIPEQVAEELRQEMRAGVLRPGTPLRQNEVAARLGVSPTPVREAFSLLERDGLVERRIRRGVVVFKPTAKRLLDCYEIREALETLAARRAATRLTDADLGALERLVDEMASPSETPEQYLEANAQFHHRIEAAADNEQLAELIASRRTASNAYVLFLGLEAAGAGDTSDEHAAIAAGLRRRDPEAAAAAVARHLRTRAETLRLRLEERAG